MASHLSQRNTVATVPPTGNRCPYSEQLETELHARPVFGIRRLPATSLLVDPPAICPVVKEDTLLAAGLGGAEAGAGAVFGRADAVHARERTRQARRCVARTSLVLLANALLSCHPMRFLRQGRDFAC